MKNALKKALLASCVLLLVASSLIASPDLPDGKWWKRPRVATHIGLTGDQTREIEEIFVRSRGRLIDLKADLEKKQADLQDAIDDTAADRRLVAQRIESVEDARAELQKARALMFLDMKQVLRPEQWDRLKGLQAQGRRTMEERRGRMRMNDRRERPRQR